MKQGTSLRDLAWNSLLDAEFNAIYWLYVSEHYRVREQRAKILLAMTASGTVASWALWDTFPLAWQALSAVSAAVAVILPIMNYPVRVELAAGLRGRWTEMFGEYEQLWAASQNNEPDEASLANLKKKEASVATLEAKLPRLNKVRERAQRNVEKQRGF